MLEPEGIIDDLVIDPLTEEWANKLEKLCDGNCAKCPYVKKCQRLWDKITNAQTIERRKRLYKKLWPEIKRLVRDERKA